MNPAIARSATCPYDRHPREIAAAVTLPVAADALVAPGTALLDTAGRAAVAAACGALATRLGLIRLIGSTAAPGAASVVSFDPFRDPTPQVLHGRGPVPDRARIRVAGARCVDVWHGWKQQGAPRDDRIGVAGAVALGAWCSWALGSLAQAEVRARYALDTLDTDPLAALVLRSSLARRHPTWWG